MCNRCNHIVRYHNVPGSEKALHHSLKRSPTRMAPGCSHLPGAPARTEWINRGLNSQAKRLCSLSSLTYNK
ncbi:hypothetical protein CEXT_449651 [Caerostris extrusa]|uniref:Uncharacterized protein n=1 Tax=Caerostris extrusa TaxID=172846 RepID=A0AAV4Y423_CAEEX|nr:hypothetical protein CEXT_449651 [Caerostris extrusa]